MPAIANYKYADVTTAVAGSDMTSLGQVCKVTNSSGQRVLTPITDTEDALVVSGGYAVAMKVSRLSDAVDTVVGSLSASAGSRLTTIKSGDLIQECRKGTIIEYAASELDASLDPDNSGALPVAGDPLGIKGSKWATITAATSAGIATPVVGKVFKVYAGNKVLIELVY